MMPNKKCYSKEICKPGSMRGLIVNKQIMVCQAHSELLISDIMKPINSPCYGLRTSIKERE